MPERLDELEARYIDLLESEQRDPAPGESLIRRVEEAYHAVADVKDDLSLCLALRCRNRTADHAYCRQHR